MSGARSTSGMASAFHRPVDSSAGSAAAEEQLPCPVHALEVLNKTAVYESTQQIETGRLFEKSARRVFLEIAERQRALIVDAGDCYIDAVKGFWYEHGRNIKFPRLPGLECTVRLRDDVQPAAEAALPSGFDAPPAHAPSVAAPSEQPTDTQLPQQLPVAAPPTRRRAPPPPPPPEEEHQQQPAAPPSGLLTQQQPAAAPSGSPTQQTQQQQQQPAAAVSTPDQIFLLLAHNGQELMDSGCNCRILDGVALGKLTPDGSKLLRGRDEDLADIPLEPAAPDPSGGAWARYVPTHFVGDKARTGPPALALCQSRPGESDLHFAARLQEEEQRLQSELTANYGDSEQRKAAGWSMLADPPAASPSGQGAAGSSGQGAASPSGPSAEPPEGTQEFFEYRLRLKGYRAPDYTDRYIAEWARRLVIQYQQESEEIQCRQ